MTSKVTNPHPLLILLAVALASVLFVVSCGDDEATAVPEVPEAPAAPAAEAAANAAELASALEAAQEAEAAEVAKASETAAMAAEEAAAQAAELAAAALAATAAEEAVLPGAPKRGGTLTMAMVADHVSLDPPLQNSAVDVAITQATYDNLIMVQPDSSLKPELATSWEANDDLSSFTFHLRQGVKFHHGKDFKAEDVLFTFNRLLDPVLDSPIRPTFASTIDDMVIIDDYTIRFDLLGPNGFFLDSLSLQQVRILPADVDTSRLTLEEFGTGPFMILEHLPSERTTMVGNPDYWEEGKPYLDEFIILNIAEAATRGEALQSGDVDVVFDLAFQSVAAIEAHPDTVVLETPGAAWLGLPMRTDMPPFDNLLVRKAFQAATDRESIRQAALLGRGTIAYDHPVPSNSRLFAPQYKPPDYNPELAKQLLADAGYPDGIDVTLHTADVAAGMIEMAVAFKESAAPAGIRVDIQRQSTDGFWDRYWNVEPFTVTWWSGRPNPDLALSIQYHSDSSWDATRYRNPVLDELIVRARGESLEDQKASYAEIQRMLIDDVPRIVAAFKPMLYGARSSVRSVSPHPLGPIAIIVQDGWLDD